MLHEISHTWFNKNMFTDRWVSEGFADEFASRALEKSGEALQAPDVVAPDSPGAFKLNDWNKPKLQDSSTSEQELFGYNASWTVVRTISTEIGMDKLAKVVAEAAQQRLAYQGPTSADKTVATTGSHELLDLLEEAGGSTKATDLFVQFVLTPAEAASIAARNDARIAYHQFVDGSGGWVPLAIRTSMGTRNCRPDAS